MICIECGVFFPDGQTKCPQCGEEINHFGIVPTKKTINILGIVAAIITVIGVFLPAIYLVMGDFSVGPALIKVYGKTILVLSIVFVILVFMKKEKAAQVLALMATVLMIYKFFAEPKEFKEYEELGATVGFSIGFYLCLVGSIVMLISPFIWNKLQRNK